jgi:hypothetical protein
MKGKKALKPGSVPSIFPFLHRKPERELSYKRAQIREKIAKDVLFCVNRLDYEICKGYGRGGQLLIYCTFSIMNARALLFRSV